MLMQIRSFCLCRPASACNVSMINWLEMTSLLDMLLMLHLCAGGARSIHTSKYGDDKLQVTGAQWCNVQRHSLMCMHTQAGLKMYSKLPQRLCHCHLLVRFRQPRYRPREPDPMPDEAGKQCC